MILPVTRITLHPSLHSITFHDVDNVLMRSPERGCFNFGPIQFFVGNILAVSKQFELGYETVTFHGRALRANYQATCRVSDARRVTIECTVSMREPSPQRSAHFNLSIKEFQRMVEVFRSI